MSSDKVAIVTAAGRGMGTAIARELAAGGYALALLSPSRAAEELASAPIGKRGPPRWATAAESDVVHSAYIGKRGARSLRRTAAAVEPMRSERGAG